MHFEGLEELPTISWNKPGKINVQSLAQSVSTLVGGEIIHWNKELEDHVREQFELPSITDEQIKEEEEHSMELQNQMMGPVNQHGNSPNSNRNSDQKGQTPGPNAKEKVSESMT